MDKTSLKRRKSSDIYNKQTDPTGYQHRFDDKRDARVKTLKILDDIWGSCWLKTKARQTQTDVPQLLGKQTYMLIVSLCALPCGKFSRLCYVRLIFVLIVTLTLD